MSHDVAARLHFPNVRNPNMGRVDSGVGEQGRPLVLLLNQPHAPRTRVHGVPSQPSRPPPAAV